MNSFYNLRIPKTGTLYLKNNLFVPLKECLLKNNVEVINFGDHEGWGPVKEDTYILSTFRDPVKRTVSHFCHESAYFDNTPSGYLSQNKNTLLSWLENNKKRISDFQSKNILYSKPENLRGTGWMEIKDPEFLEINVDKDTVVQRINSINILVDASSLNIKTLQSISIKVCNDFGIPYEKIVSDKEAPKAVAGFSDNIYLSLTEQEKNLIYDYNKVDSEIYFTSKYFMVD